VTRPDRNALGTALRRLYAQASAPGRLLEQLAGSEEIQGAFDPTLDALPLLHERIGTALWAGTGLEASIARSLARVSTIPPAPVPVAPVVARPAGRMSANTPAPAASRARVAALLDEIAAVEQAPASRGADAGAREQPTRGGRGRGAARASAQSDAARRAAPSSAAGLLGAAGARTQSSEDPAPARARRAWMTAPPGRAAAGAPVAGQADEPASRDRVSAPQDRVSEPPGRAPALQDRASGKDRVRARQVSPRRLSIDAAQVRWQRAAERAGVASVLARPVVVGAHAGVASVADRARDTYTADARAQASMDTVDTDARAVVDPAAHAARSASISALLPDGAIAELDTPAALTPEPGATARRISSALSRLAHARRASQRAGAAAPAGAAEWPASAPAVAFSGPRAHAGPEPFAGLQPFAAAEASSEPPGLSGLSGLSGLRRMAALAGADPALGALPGSDTTPVWPVQPQAGAHLPLPAAPPVWQPGSREDRALADRIAEILRREAARHGIDVERDEP
jgi:hypothetical protein